MRSTFIVEDPPQGLVAFQHLVGKDGAVHGAIDFLFHGRNLGVAEFVGDVVVRIVTIFRDILTVAVCIIERSQVVGDAIWVFSGTRGRPILDDRRDVGRVAVLVVHKELVHFGTGDLEDLVPTGTGLRRDAGHAVDSQRASVVVVTDLTETQGGALQLVIDVDTGDPQRTGEQGGGRAVGRDEVLGTGTCREVPPHVTTRVDTRSNVVDVEPFER